MANTLKKTKLERHVANMLKNKTVQGPRETVIKSSRSEEKFGKTVVKKEAKVNKENTAPESEIRLKAATTRMEHDDGLGLIRSNSGTFWPIVLFANRTFRIHREPTKRLCHLFLSQMLRDSVAESEE